MPTIFLDLDNVLFDADGFKKDLGGSVEEILGGSDKFWRVYEETREAKGVVDFKNIWSVAERFWGESKTEKVKTWFKEVDLSEYLMEGVEELLNFLKTKYELKILTEGSYDWQLEKLRRTGLLDHFTKDGCLNVANSSILACEDKFRFIPQLMDSEKCSRSPVVVEDKLEILREVKRVNPEAVCILMNHGVYAERSKGEDLGDIIKVESLTEVMEKVKQCSKEGDRGVGKEFYR